MQQQSTVVWKGTFKNGVGAITTGSGALKGVEYSYSTRFEGQRGTNPEEIIAAAHASCFTMEMADELTKRGFEINIIDTKAVITAERLKDEVTIISSQLTVEADIPGISEGEFRSIADCVKVECPVSRALNLEISVVARLKNESQEIFIEQMI